MPSRSGRCRATATRAYRNGGADTAPPPLRGPHSHGVGRKGQRWLCWKQPAANWAPLNEKSRAEQPASARGRISASANFACHNNAPSIEAPRRSADVKSASRRSAPSKQAPWSWAWLKLAPIAQHPLADRAVGTRACNCRLGDESPTVCSTRPALALRPGTGGQRWTRDPGRTGGGASSWEISVQPCLVTASGGLVLQAPDHGVALPQDEIVVGIERVGHPEGVGKQVQMP